MFQTRLRELREARGYKSQQAFANAFGVAQSTVGGWEAGKREPNYETTIRLAHFFEVPVSCLLDDRMEDNYSARFRSNLLGILSTQEPPDISDGEMYSDYLSLEALLDGTYPLSLAQACEAADKVGVTVDELLVKEQKNSPSADETAPGDNQEDEIMRLVCQMTAEQKDFLIALLNTTLSRNQGTLAVDQVLNCEITLKSEHQDWTK